MVWQDKDISERWRTWKFQNVDILILNSSKVLIHRPSLFQLFKRSACPGQTRSLMEFPWKFHAGSAVEPGPCRPRKKPQTRRKGQAPASHALRGGSCETPTPQIMTNLSPHLGILYEYLDKILGLPMKMMEDEVENHRHHHRKNHRPGLKGQPKVRARSSTR